jgi:hypothetical protein
MDTNDESRPLTQDDALEWLRESMPVIPFQYETLFGAYVHGVIPDGEDCVVAPLNEGKTVHLRDCHGGSVKTNLHIHGTDHPLIVEHSSNLRIVSLGAASIHAVGCHDIEVRCSRSLHFTLLLAVAMGSSAPPC